MCGSATGDKVNSNKRRWVRDLDKSPRITPLYELFLFKPSSAYQGFPVELYHSSDKTTISQEKKVIFFSLPHDAAATYQLMKKEAFSFIRFKKYQRQHLTFRSYLHLIPFMYSKWSLNVICRQLFICKSWNGVGVYRGEAECTVDMEDKTV